MQASRPFLVHVAQRKNVPILTGMIAGSIPAVDSKYGELTRRVTGAVC